MRAERRGRGHSDSVGGQPRKREEPVIESTPRKWRSDGSPVSGDAHAGFCGGPGGEIPPGYPTW